MRLQISKANMIVWVFIFIMLIAIFLLSGCAAQLTCKEIRDANNPAYVLKYVRTIYWDCEVAKIADFEFLILEPDGTIFHALCNDPYTPAVTTKYKVHFKKMEGDSLRINNVK